MRGRPGSRIWIGRLTSNIGDTEDSDGARLENAALVWQEGSSTRSWHGLGSAAGCTVGKAVTTGVVVGVAGRLLDRL